MQSAAHALEDFKVKRAISQTHRKDMGLAHFQTHELKQMNFAQGGESIDPETNFPEYSRFGEILKNPSVKRFFLGLKEQVEEYGEIDPALKKLAVQIRKKVPDFVKTHAPLKEEEAYKQAGIGGDTQIALVPFSVLKFFDEIRGKPVTNPKTGLPMYDFAQRMRSKYRVDPPEVPRSPPREEDDDDNSGEMLGGLVNVGLTLLGAAMGGPTGATAGSALGKSITASDVGKIKKSSQQEEETPGHDLMSYNEKDIKKPPKTESESPWRDFAKQSLPYALTIAGALATAQGARKQKAEEERRYKRDKEEQERRLRVSGYHSPLKSHYTSHGDPHRDVSLPKAVEYKAGGAVQGKPIKGPGNGQDDLIKVDSTREGEWIWDASTVADLGDGSTDAGWKEIRTLENKIKRRPGFKEMHDFKPGVAPQKVKTALSNGEFRTPTKIVTALGQGDNAKGADILRRMTQNIRLYKNSKGDQLPPPIKNPAKFLEQAIHQEMNHG